VWLQLRGDLVPFSFLARVGIPRRFLLLLDHLPVWSTVLETDVARRVPPPPSDFPSDSLRFFLCVE